MKAIIKHELTDEIKTVFNVSVEMPDGLICHDNSCMEYVWTLIGVDHEAAGVTDNMSLKNIIVKCRDFLSGELDITPVEEGF